MKKILTIVLILLILLLPFLWYTLSPLFIDEVVSEKNPFEIKAETHSDFTEILKNNETKTIQSQKIEINQSNFTTPKEELSTLHQDTQNEIVQLISAEFKDADSSHKVSGTTSVLYNTEQKFLRFEDFSSTNGPDLYVYLATDESAEDFVNLGELKGNVGDQNYELSKGIDLEKYDTVLIWCQRFGVLFGSAKLS